jgi:hypothetical protein
VLCEIACNSTVVLIRLHLEDVKHCCNYQKVFGNLHAFFDGGSPLKTLPCHVVDSLMELMDPSACPNPLLFVYVMLSHSCRLFVPYFLT